MKKHDKEFKLNAVNYYLNHKELGRAGCAKNLGIGNSTLSKWVAEYQNSGDIEVRGSGNFQSDEAKENARLRKELRDTQDALEILKKAINILGK
ncbi:MAG: transposase [Culicoidibacterales bacterium]